MKYSRLPLLVVLAFTVAAASLAAQQATTVEGTLVDSKCYLGDNQAGNDHGAMKACGTMCLKGGTPAGVLTKDKKFHAIIAPSTALADLVGQTVRVNGSITNGSILVKKVEVDKGGKWQEVKLDVMM